MAALRRRGFTLIELLTVVAIIAVLAGILLPVLSGVQLRARIAAAESNMEQMALALNEYLADNGSYPPGYGYMRVDGTFVLEPWYSIVGIYNDPTARDTFVDNHDANRDGQIGVLEYLPVGIPSPGDITKKSFPDELYDPFGTVTGAVAQDRNLQLNERRPFIYIPINTEDFKKVSRYLNGNPTAGDFEDRQKARVWNPSSRLFDTIANSVPTRYDAFVLIGAGGGGDIGGILPTPIDMGSNNFYYTTGLLAYFLATRDANSNGELDYDYASRTGGGSDKPGAFSEFGAAGATLHVFPDGTNGQGPLIYKSP